MIKNLDFLGKPSIEKISLFVGLGTSLFVLGVVDLLLNSFFGFNLTSFLPRWLNYLTPLIFCFLGLHYIRIDYSGNKNLDRLNKNLNSNWFNSLLSILIIFSLILSIPPILDWLFFDANFSGETKEDCTGDGACWIFIKIWLPRFIYGMYPLTEIWRINTTFILLIGLVILLFVSPQKYKKYLVIFLLFVFPFIMINLLSGGNFGLKWVETNSWGGLSLTFIISIFALIFCFPVGIFLALGRRASTPVTRYSSIGFI